MSNTPHPQAGVGDASAIRFEKLGGSHWIESLADGMQVLIRPLREEDRERTKDFIHKLHEVGVSRYSASAGQRRCEYAVTVADDWRQRDPGVLLMRYLIDLARSNGYKQMISLDATDNETIRDLAGYWGFHRRLDPGDSTQTIHTLNL